MSKNSAGHEKKVEHAVWKLLKHPGLSIPNAMVWAKISKKDACCQQNCALSHWAVRQLQDRTITTKHSTYNATINFKLTTTTTMKQLKLLIVAH